MASITAADAVLTLSIAVLFPIPQQLQGFAADDVYDIPAVRSVEVMMGVDGVLSSGFVFVPVPQRISLQADSLSNDVFDTWWMQMQSTRGNYRASGLIRLPAIGKKYQMLNGALTEYKPAPSGKKVLQPRTYEITWESINPGPA